MLLLMPLGYCQSHTRTCVHVTTRIATDSHTCTLRIAKRFDAEIYE